MIGSPFGAFARSLASSLSKPANVFGMLLGSPPYFFSLRLVVEDADRLAELGDAPEVPLPNVLPSGVQRNCCVVPGVKYLFQPYFLAYLSSGLISFALTSRESMP